MNLPVIYLIISLLSSQNFSNQGDNNNTHSISRYIAKQLQKSNKEVITEDIYDLTSMSDIISQNKDKTIIIVGTGTKHIDEIADTNHEATLIFSAHQYTSQIDKLIGKADIISIGSHTMDQKIIDKINNNGSIYVPQFGASSSINIEDIDKNYEKLKQEFQDFKLSEKLALVMLGGDSKTGNSELKFDLDNAYITGLEIARNMRARNISKAIVSDSRRTGSYINSGKNIDDLDREINPVTESFIKALRDEKIEILYKPYIHNIKNVPSAYKAFFKYGLADHIYYTMESVSTGFELAMFGHLIGNISAIEISSTTKEHKKFAHDLYDLGYINLIESGEIYKNKIITKIANEPLDKDINNKRIFEALIKKINP